MPTFSHGVGNVERDILPKKKKIEKTQIYLIKYYLLISKGPIMGTIYTIFLSKNYTSGLPNCQFECIIYLLLSLNFYFLPLVMNIKFT
jgi:hypothetical protein